VASLGTYFDDLCFKTIWSHFFSYCNSTLLTINQGLQNIGTLPSHVPTDSRRKVLEYRRAILLTLVAGTPSNNPALVGATSKLMVSARIWLDDALSNSKCTCFLE
jgi:hypothetical protein